MKRIALFAALILATPAYAQPAPPSASVVQRLMESDAQMKAALGAALDKANEQIAALKAENETLKKAAAEKHAEPKPKK